MSGGNSRIFIQNRALGYVTNGIPHVIRYIKKRKENLVVTCVGKAFHTYGCDRFTLLSVSHQNSSDITCLAADTFLVFTACNNTIYAWRRGVELKHEYRGHSKPVHLILPFGPCIVSIDEDSFLFVWDIKTESKKLELMFSNDVFRITTICHPATYINKILLGSEQGVLQLWNINTSKLIYTFKGWSSSVTALEQSTALDVIAVGLRNGKIILHDIKFDETLMKFTQDWGPVTSLSFRTDGPPVLISGSTVGHVVVWNLEERKVMSQLLHAHHGCVTGLNCLPNEPLMVTTSPDNSLKLWIFDKTDGGARLLRIREGHNSPPTFLRFYDELGHNILSSGTDSSMRIFNLVTEIANKSLGRASYNRSVSKKKGKHTQFLIMPPITKFAAKVANDIEFDDVASLHLRSPRVTTWSYHYSRMSEVHILHDRFKAINRKAMKAEATSICFSSCMNFVCVGYSNGFVDKFNVQSGLCRGTYGTPTAHEKAVRGIATDHVDRVLVTGGGDGLIKFWSFKAPDKPALSSLGMDDGVLFFANHQESSMLAVALDDFSLVLVDMDSRIVVRKFVGHTGVINDATFSPDARWLLTTAMDSSIRTWDILTGQLIDYILVDVPCISLSFSPTGEYLATIHVDCFGIYLWANKTLFSHVSLRPVTDLSKFATVTLKAAGSAEENDVEMEEIEEEAPEEDTASVRGEHNQQIMDLITLSHSSSHKWQNIIDIDIIRKRNKPKEPPKVPEAAPFFLPTLPSLTTKFDFSDVAKSDDKGKNKKIALTKFTSFGAMLNEAVNDGDYRAAIETFKTFSPSTIHFEIASLSVDSGEPTKLMKLFVKMLQKMLESRNDFELTQSYLGTFLKIHNLSISSNPKLLKTVNSMQQLQEDVWKNLENQMLYCLAVTDHF